jgi:hypothetical protein
MAYQDAGLMENWIADRINIDVAAPKATAQDVGKMENWIADRIFMVAYAEADAAVGANAMPQSMDLMYRRRVG